MEDNSQSVLCSSSRPGEVGGGDDFAFAKLMQEQERALYELLRLREQEGWRVQAYLDAAGSTYESTSEYEIAEIDEAAHLPTDLALSDEVTNSESHEADDNAEELAWVQEDQGLGSVVDDAEFARRLQIEEVLDGTYKSSDEESEYDEEDGQAEEYGEDQFDPDVMTYEELRALSDAIGVVSKGISQQTIDQIPIIEYPGSSEHSPKCCHAACQPSQQEEQCVVCRMEFELGERVKILPCKHVFHPACIDHWLRINKACPICAKEVAEKGAGHHAGCSKGHPVGCSHHTDHSHK